MTLTQQQGYLSSYVTSHTLCGAQHSPWVVQGQHGQKINLTLYDFSAAGKDEQDRLSCPVSTSVLSYQQKIDLG